MSARPILTAAEMVAAEQAVIAGGTSVETLMERAGRAVADLAWRIGGAGSVVVLCGPGNNGGDGYVAARILAERGCRVRIGALAEPKTEAAGQARAKWTGPVEPLGSVEGAPLVIDALFGTGLARGLDEDLAGILARHVGHARHAVAVDLPSGVETDGGRLLSPVPRFDATVALGALKRAHRLQPAAGRMGEVVLGEIGIPCTSGLHEIGPPRLAAPPPEAHKYARGYVVVVPGEMPGAATLTAAAALRAGAGYVAVAGPERFGGPDALVLRPAAEAAALRDRIDDDRIDVVAFGPGLGRGGEAEARLDAALNSGRRLVLDADALTLIAGRGVEALHMLPHAPVLTPHAGEFARLFGDGEASKVDRARDAARRARAVVVFKGSDTVVADPDGRAAIAPAAPSWLATAGTGDVLTGIVAARVASGGDPFEAACEAVWLHAEAARRAGPFLIADDLVAALPAALAPCLG